MAETPGPRLADAVRHAAATLAAAGIEAAPDEARRLVMAALGVDALALVTGAERTVTEGEQARIGAFLARRAAREPLSRIAGEREFYGLNQMTPGTQVKGAMLTGGSQPPRNRIVIIAHMVTMATYSASM